MHINSFPHFFVCFIFVGFFNVFFPFPLNSVIFLLLSAKESRRTSTLPAFLSPRNNIFSYPFKEDHIWRRGTQGSLLKVTQLGIIQVEVQHIGEHQVEEGSSKALIHHKIPQLRAHHQPGISTQMILPVTQPLYSHQI